MATVDGMLSRVRLEIGDPVTPFRTTAPGDGVTTWFDLPKQEINAGSVTAEINDGTAITTLAGGTGFTLNAELGQVQLAEPVPVNAMLIISGTAWALFSDAELTQILSDSVRQHCYGQSITERYRDSRGFIAYRETPKGLANLPSVEEPLVIMLTTVNLLWTMANDAASDSSVQTAEGTVIDRAARYRQIMDQIQALTTRYQTYSGQLNTGLYRSETLQLRRTSYTTGRLVPLFRPREFDDHRWPQREIPAVDHRNDDNSGVPTPLWNGNLGT